MTDKPATVWVTQTEGGEYVKFPCHHLNGPKGIRVHAIGFEDGSVWDAYNGWQRVMTAGELAEVEDIISGAKQRKEIMQHLEIHQELTNEVLNLVRSRAERLKPIRAVSRNVT